MTTLNIGGMGFIRKYDQIQDAVAVSKPNDTIIIHKNITIDQPMKIDHDINIEAEDNIQITIADGTVGIELVKGKLNLKNMLVFNKRQSIFIYKTSPDDASITLTHSQIFNIDSQITKDYFPAIVVNNDDGAFTTNITINNSVIEFINVAAKSLSINASNIGSILKVASSIVAYFVEAQSSNLSNVRVKAKYCDLLNQRSNGQLEIDSNLSLNGFTVDPLPISSEPRARDNQLVNYQQDMKRFNNKRDVVALKVSGNESNLRVRIQNASLNTEILAAQSQVLNVVAWFEFSNCDANINSSILSHTERQNVSAHGSLSIIDVTDNADHFDNNWLIQDPQY